MKNLLFRTCDMIESFIRIFGAMLLVIMIFSISYEVVLRYIFNAPTFWAEALSRNAMIWVVLLGLALGIRQKENIYVDFLLHLFSNKLKTLAAWIRFACVFCFAGVLLIYGSIWAFANLSQSITGLPIPTFAVYICVPISAFFMLLFTVELIVNGERGPF